MILVVPLRGHQHCPMIQWRRGLRWQGWLKIYPNYMVLSMEYSLNKESHAWTSGLILFPPRLVIINNDSTRIILEMRSFLGLESKTTTEVGLLSTCTRNLKCNLILKSLNAPRMARFGICETLWNWWTLSPPSTQGPIYFHQLVILKIIEFDISPCITSLGGSFK